MSVFLALLLAASGLEEDGPASRLSLEPGEQRSFQMEGLERVIVSGEAIEVRRVGEDEFVLFGINPGRAQLTIQRRGFPAESWHIEVRPRRADAIRSACAELFGRPGCADLEVIEAAGRLVLSARVRDLETYHRVRQLVRLFPELYPLVEVEPAVLDALAAVITAELRRAGFEKAQLVRVGRRLFLEGTVADEVERRKARLIVDALYEEALSGR